MEEGTDLKRWMLRALPLLLAAGLCLLGGCGAPVGNGDTGPSGEPASVQTPQTDTRADADPRAAMEETAERMLERMTLEEKVGQMFFVRCPEENAAADVQNYALGGVLLFGRDFDGRTYGEVRALTDGLQRSAKIPLLIGTDEEGGTVVRASADPHLRRSKFLSPQALYAQGGMDAVTADAAEKSSFLLGLGVNVNFAPVCDVSTDPADFIYARTLGQDAETTAEYVGDVTAVMARSGIGAVLKHFPGYGNNADTHTGVAVDGRPYETFAQSDFLPFRAGASSSNAAVLVSHNIVECMDDALPASLSPAVHELLRTELSFDGVVMTDDLAMDALARYTSDGTVAVLAVQAGNDMLVTTDYQSQIPQVIAAVENGEISTARIDEAVTRVLLWKMRLGLIDGETGAP